MTKVAIIKYNVLTFNNAGTQEQLTLRDAWLKPAVLNEVEFLFKWRLYIFLVLWLQMILHDHSCTCIPAKN